MSVATANTNTGGVTKQDLIDIGRPNGPDLQLKFNPPTLLDTQTTTVSVQNIIRNDSSITEVLNVISFLISATRTFAAMVDTDNSAYNGTSKGAIEASTGYYAVPGPAVDFADAPLNLTTLAVTPPPGDLKIPVSILKRRGAASATPNDPESFENMAASVITNAAGQTEVKALFSDCVKQMIKLLQQTRTILGPKGWTDLFQKVKGGSKKTQHRRHRRRYSSKQY